MKRDPGNASYLRYLVVVLGVPVGGVLLFFLLSAAVTATQMKRANGCYTPFWAVIHDFQSLIGAIVSLVAVIGAIFGILLKAKIDRSIVEHRDRDARRATAATLGSLIRTERKFPTVSLLRIPTEPDVCHMLAGGTGVALGANDYIRYLASFVSALGTFPSAIADRASFLSWVSGRIALAVTQVPAGTAMSEASVRDRAGEIRLLIIAGIEVLIELEHELSTYAADPMRYEENWQDDPDAKSLRSSDNHSGLFTSVAFDLDDLQSKVLQIARQT